MNRLKPRIPLDKNILERINKYYGYRLSPRVLYRECFSHPALDMHFCNPLAKLEGGDNCSYCNHAPGGICKITCHVSRYCLAVFAFRLDIGDPVYNKAMKVNLGISYEKLYKIVDAHLNETPVDDGTAQDLSKIETTPEERNPEKEEPPKSEKKPRQPPKKEKVLDAEGRELVDIPEAAKLYDCSYRNMYVHVKKRQNLEQVEVDGKVYVRKEDVLKMKEKRVYKNKNKS